MFYNLKRTDGMQLGGVSDEGASILEGCSKDMGGGVMELSCIAFGFGCERL